MTRSIWNNEHTAELGIFEHEGRDARLFRWQDQAEAEAIEAGEGWEPISYAAAFALAARG